MNDVPSIPAKSTTRAPTNWTQTLGILPILILLYLFFFALSENFRSAFDVGWQAVFSL